MIHICNEGHRRGGRSGRGWIGEQERWGMRRTQPPRRRSGVFWLRGVRAPGQAPAAAAGAAVIPRTRQSLQLRPHRATGRTSWLLYSSARSPVLFRTTAGSSLPQPAPHGMCSSSWHGQLPPSASTSTPQRPPRKWVSFWRHLRTGAWWWLTDGPSKYAENTKRHICEKI